MDAASMSKDARWIYNDVNRGFEDARRMGKPLLVVCAVPCLARGWTGWPGHRPIHRAGSPAGPVRVRPGVINANALDLSVSSLITTCRFQRCCSTGTGLCTAVWLRAHQTTSDRAVEGFQVIAGGALDPAPIQPIGADSKANRGSTPYHPVDFPTAGNTHRSSIEGRVGAELCPLSQIGDAFGLRFA